MEDQPDEGSFDRARRTGADGGGEVTTIYGEGFVADLMERKMAESNLEQKSYQRGYNRGYSTGQKNTGKYIDRTVRLRTALQQIADMDPKCERADDLGRAARVALDALATDGVQEVSRG